MSTNQKWSFALNLLICFKKRIVNFDNWGNWPLKQIFFPKIVKIKGIIPKFHFFLKKQSKICCSQKNPKKQQQKTKQKTKKQQKTKQKNNSRKQNKKERKTTKNKTKNKKNKQTNKQKTSPYALFQKILNVPSEHSFKSWQGYYPFVVYFE